MTLARCPTARSRIPRPNGLKMTGALPLAGRAAPLSIPGRLARMKSRLPLRCSARWIEVSARQTWSASSTTLSAPMMISGARSRSETCRTTLPAGHRSTAVIWGVEAVVASEASAHDSSTSTALAAKRKLADGERAASLAPNCLALRSSRSYKRKLPLPGQRWRRKRAISKLIGPQPIKPMSPGQSTQRRAPDFRGKRRST